MSVSVCMTAYAGVMYICVSSMLVCIRVHLSFVCIRTVYVLCMCMCVRVSLCVHMCV